jgi:uncharacterized Zn finger protein
MKAEVEKTKISVVCNECGKVFTTTIGWAMKRKNKLICSKCVNKKEVNVNEDIDVKTAIEVLRGYGLKIQ